MRCNAVRAVSWCVVLSVSLARLVGAADLSLADAVKHGDVPAVQALLAQGTDVNTRLVDGTTVLHWAVHRDDPGTVALLIAAGARANVADDHGVTPLWLACTNRNAQVVEQLLKAGANPNARLPRGETVLMRAAHTGNSDIVKLLVERGADVNATETSLGQTALMMAAVEGHSEAVRLLIDHGADIGARSMAGFTPFLLAARHTDVAAVKALLEAGADVNEAALDGTTALVIATIRGNTSVVRFLLENGADPNVGPGFAPLHWAVGRWHYGEPRAQANAGREDEDSDWRVFEGLQGLARLELVTVLLTHGANPNVRASREPTFARGPLTAAARSRQGAPAQAVQPPAAPPAPKPGSPPPQTGLVRPAGTLRSIVGATPFWIAARVADIEVMRLLVASGADPSLATNRNVTPLMAAAGVGFGIGTNPVPQQRAVEAIKLCLELGNDINVSTPEGETAMHGAGYRGPQGADLILKFLVENGADMNAKNWAGWTALTIVEGLYFGASNTTFEPAAAVLRSLGAEPTPADVNRQVGTILGAVWNQ